MYAVIKAGGKQQKVKPGDVIEVELQRGQDEDIAFTPLLVVDDDGTTHFGKALAKATVTGKRVGEEKGEKVNIFKYRAKTGYSRRQGHRQTYTLVRIDDVSLSAGSRGKRARPAAPEPADDEPGRQEPESEVEGAAGADTAGEGPEA